MRKPLLQLHHSCYVFPDNIELKINKSSFRNAFNIGVLVGVIVGTIELVGVGVSVGVGVVVVVCEGFGFGAQVPQFV